MLCKHARDAISEVRRSFCNVLLLQLTYRPIHTGSNSSKCTLPSANKILFDETCWDSWIGYNGKLEGYIYTKKNGLHKGVCVRQIGTDIAVKFNLNVVDKVWIVKVESCTWRPNEQSIISTTSGNWHLTLMLICVVQLGSKFGDWNLSKNNCRDWSKGLFVMLFDNEDVYKKLKLSNSIQEGVELIKLIKRLGWDINFMPELRIEDSFVIISNT